MKNSSKTMTAMRTRLEALTDIAEALQKAVSQAWDEFEKMAGADQPLKDGFGKISDAGVAMMRHMFEDGQPNWKIAETFDVSPSAIVYRRKRWEAGKA